MPPTRKAPGKPARKTARKPPAKAAAKPGAARRTPKAPAASALLNISIVSEFGTVDPNEWDRGSGETVDVASREKSEADLRGRPCFGVGGVPRNRTWITEIGRERRHACGSTADPQEFVLVRLVALR